MVLKEGRWLCLGLGLILGISFSIFWILIPAEFDPILIRCVWSAAAEWNITLGIYILMRKLVTRQLPHASLLSQVAMPFYLTHRQILMALLMVSQSVPVLKSFPIILTLTTVITTFISLLITKSNPLRYWFGLSTSKGSVIPGSSFGGFLPLIVLTITVVLVYTIKV